MCNDYFLSHECIDILDCAKIYVRVDGGRYVLSSCVGILLELAEEGIFKGKINKE